MKTTLTRTKLELKQSPIHGYGVFADQDVEPFETIEECYLLVSHQTDLAFDNYYFKHKGVVYLPLGFGALYNHANEANAEYAFDRENRIMEVYATKPIKKGEEIFIYYGKNWFSSRNMATKPASSSFTIRAMVSSWSFIFRFMLIAGVIYALRFFQ